MPGQEQEGQVPGSAKQGTELEWNGLRFPVDEHGFIREPERWNEQFALALASSEGLAELSESHWKVIHYIRDYYREFKSAPMVRKMCEETGLTLRQIYQLFPSGPENGACKVAGLPKPAGCA